MKSRSMNYLLLSAVAAAAISPSTLFAAPSMSSAQTTLSLLSPPSLLSQTSAPPAPPAPFAVVELFTSEGCSSCPPADKLLSDLAAEAESAGKPVYTLSFHVDYWNHLGWTDPFSRPEFTARQQRYAQNLDGRVYTPQMIVNGSEEFVGSRGGAARRSIGNALGQSAGAAIALTSVKNGDGTLTVGFAVTGHREGDLLNLAVVEQGISVPVKRGENGGRTLKHENVVRAFRTVRLDAKGGGSLGLEVPASVFGGRGWIIAFVQKPGTLRTIGAARAGI
jgi:hypothetical protein